jgi:hypothetical protein
VVALAQTTIELTGVALPIRTATQGATMLSLLLMVPLAPQPGFGFVLRLGNQTREPDTTNGNDRPGWRLRRGVGKRAGQSGDGESPAPSPRRMCLRSVGNQ